MLILSQLSRKVSMSLGPGASKIAQQLLPEVGPVLVVPRNPLSLAAPKTLYKLKDLPEKFKGYPFVVARNCNQRPNESWAHAACTAPPIDGHRSWALE